MQAAFTGELVRAQPTDNATNKLMQRWRETGSYEAKPMGGYRGHKLSEHTELVQQIVKAKPDITLAELRAKLKAQKILVGQTSV